MTLVIPNNNIPKVRSSVFRDTFFLFIKTYNNRSTKKQKITALEAQNINPNKCIAKKK